MQLGLKLSIFENLFVQSLWKPGLLLVDLHWKLFITSFALLQKFSDLSESSQSIYTSQHHAQGVSWEKFIIRISVTDSAKYYTSLEKKQKADGNHMRRNADVWVLIGNPIIRLAC